MRKILMLLTVLLLTACNPATDETTSNYILPKGMENCKIFRLEAGAGKTTLYAVSCPHATTTTTYQKDKNSSNSVAIDNP